MIAEFEGDTTQLAKPADEPVNKDTNGSTLTDLKIVDRVAHIPLVADGLVTFETVIKANQFTASLYQTATGIAAKSLDMASPVINRTQPLIAKADGLANQGLDMVEARFPYAFKATTDEIISNAKGIYDQRVGHLLPNEVVKRVIEQIYELKDRLAATGQAAGGQVHSISTGIAEQLHKLAQHAEIPASTKEALTAAYGDIKDIVGKEESTAQGKATEILHYVQSKVQPELERLTNSVFKQKGQAVETEKTS